MIYIYLSSFKYPQSGRMSILFLCVCLFFGSKIYAQEEHEFPTHSSEGEYEEENEGEESYWRLSLLLAHTYIPTETSQGRETLVLPTIAVDIEYWVSEKWGIGMHNDIELEQFEVEKEDKKIIERNFPVVITLDGLFKVWQELIVVAGLGVEIESEESFGIARIGLEYEIPLGSGHKWDFSPSVTYDIRPDAFDTISLGVGVGRRF